MAFNKYSNELYISFRDINNGDEITVLQYDGNDWNATAEVGSGTFNVRDSTEIPSWSVALHFCEFRFGGGEFGFERF